MNLKRNFEFSKKIYAKATQEIQKMDLVMSKSPRDYHHKEDIQATFIRTYIYLRSAIHYDWSFAFVAETFVSVASVR